MSVISTHVLDSVLGTPAVGINVRLEKFAGGDWIEVASGATDGDGRCGNLKPDAAAGAYRLTFDTGAYLSRNGRASIYPEIVVAFTCDGAAHYHLPLLLSDNSYTTYRGS
ncbi:MAG: hydroxyisourate hydrolase [Terracidiphilus sp.]|jgi:5-hydroxyisourate hydrolase